MQSAREIIYYDTADGTATTCQFFAGRKLRQMLELALTTSVFFSGLDFVKQPSCSTTTEVGVSLSAIRDITLPVQTIENTQPKQ